MPDRKDREREEKLEAGELNRSAIQKKIGGNDDIPQTEFQKKLSNFWFYHKWKVILGLAFLVVVVVCTCQMCSNTKTDASLLYAGSHYMDQSQRLAVEQMCATYIPKDTDGDGSKYLNLNVINVYSDSQVEELNKKIATDTNASRVNSETNTNELKNFDSLMMTGEYPVCIVEPWLFDRVAKAGGFRKLSDVLGAVPENAYSEYAVYLADTAVYKENPGLFDGFTADTLLCLRTQSQLGNLFGNRGGEESYNRAVAYFKVLVQGTK